MRKSKQVLRTCSVIQVSILNSRILKAHTGSVVLSNTKMNLNRPPRPHPNVVSAKRLNELIDFRWHRGGH
jgi:hypothetical protein